MPLMSDRVLESTTTTGTGTFSLGGALTGYRAFNSAFSNGDVVYYTADNGQGEWEVGYGTVGTGTLSRDTVLESSNANALVDFSAGDKRVFCTAPSEQLPPDQTGSAGKILTTDGTNMSWGLIDLSTSVAGALAVSNGGTGKTSLTANRVILGNGTSAVQEVAPGTSGNILTSNGTTWVSSAPAASGAMELISTQTVSNSAAGVAWTGLSSSYNYLLIASNVGSSNNASVTYPEILVAQSGVTYLTSGYNYGNRSNTGALSVGSNQASAVVGGVSWTTGTGYMLNIAHAGGKVFIWGVTNYNGIPVPSHNQSYVTASNLTALKLYLPSYNLYGTFSLYRITK